MRAQQAEQDYQDAAERLAEIRLREDLCVLKDAKVIGMTTTGAARWRKALQEVRPRLVIVEEAAEVLEAHTITTLSQACQHLILIGDHQQVLDTHWSGMVNFPTVMPLNPGIELDMKIAPNVQLS